MNDIVLRTNFAQKLALTGYRIMLSYYGALRQSHWNRWHLFQSGHPTNSWYEEPLGIKRTPDGSAMFEWLEAADAKTKGMTVRSIFPREAS